MGRCSGSALLIEINTAGSAETPGRELVDDHEPRFRLRPAPATRGGTGGYRDYWLVEQPFSRAKRTPQLPRHPPDRRCGAAPRTWSWRLPGDRLMMGEFGHGSSLHLSRQPESAEDRKSVV